MISKCTTTCSALVSACNSPPDDQNNGSVFQLVVELGSYIGINSYWEPKLKPEMVRKEAVDVI